MIQFRISLTVFFLFYSFCAIDDGACRRERSQRGFALLNATYTSRFTSDYPSCLHLCLDDEECLSLNFWWATKKCDLNNQSRWTCAACYVDGIGATYKGMARELEISVSPSVTVVTKSTQAYVTASASISIGVISVPANAISPTTFSLVALTTQDATISLSSASIVTMVSTITQGVTYSTPISIVATSTPEIPAISLDANTVTMVTTSSSDSGNDKLDWN